MDKKYKLYSVEVYKWTNKEINDPNNYELFSLNDLVDELTKFDNNYQQLSF